MDVKEIPLGLTREEVVSLLGEPDFKGGTSRKYRRPSCYKYGNIELWFGRKDGKLHSVWDEENECLLRHD